MMDRHMDRTYWGTKRVDIDTDDIELLEKIGLYRGRKQMRADTCEFNADEMYKKYGIQDDELNARQTFQKIKGSSKGDQMPSTSTCDQQPPDNISVYTDGSYKNNRCAFSV